PQDTQDQGSGGNQKAKSSKQSLDIPLEELEHFDMPTIQPTTTAGRKAGKHLAGLNLRRGRFVRSIPGDPRSGKIDLLATITAAYIQGAQFKGAKNKLGLIIKKEHYRIKQYRQQSGLLFLFAVDGSGSMAINNYGAAKGAAIALLEKAYVYRDQVAMLFFRRNRADLLLSPGSSLSKAYRVLKRIPAGGRTPTGKAILKCLKMTKKAKLAKEVSGVVLILFTDGRANQPIQPISEQQDRETVSMKELKPLCIELGRHLAAALVIDTKRIAYQNQNAKEIAQWLNAQYLYLPKASAAQISDSLNANMDLWRSL
ncbi:MAG TPA: VWA domain-containing protein, partial [Phaeodactylibacter sp.]|nr:VWA domain-containing protein [Phaeodactylibacter sp.]